MADYVKRRKRKLDERHQTEVCAAISLGCSRAAAARMIGCSPTAIASLAKRDPTFGERLHRAEIQREIGPLRNIQVCSQKNWRAAAWILERFNPQNYGARKPDVVTPEQLTSVVEKFAEIVCRHVADADTLAKLRGEVDEVLKTIETESREQAEWRNR